MINKIILGYPCQNLGLTSKDIRIHRHCKKATWLSKGLPHVSQLALKNTKDLLPLLKWNVEHDVKLFRLHSDMFPWMSEYEFSDLPDWPEILEHLILVGQYVKNNSMRITFHPGQFNCLGSKSRKVIQNSINDLTKHGQIMDYLGFERSPWYAINIHVGGSYGDKAATEERWKSVFRQLPKSVRNRLTLENDDKAGGWSTRELYPLCEELDIPIVFDYHHHWCYPDGQTEEQALQLAEKTWKEIPPLTHKSSPRYTDGKKPPHHDYILEEITNHLAQPIYVMLEAKKKELALAEYRKNYVY